MSFLHVVIQWMHLCFDYFVEFLFGLYHGNTGQTVEAPSNKILLMSATELSDSIRSRKITSEEAVKAFIERINSVNGIINAVVDNRFSLALEEAKEVDEKIKSGQYSDVDFAKMPLLGVPFTSKESTCCKGMSATFGLLAREDSRATEDAAVIKNAKNAGGILLALTNVPQLNMWSDTFNPLFGATNNPYDSNRSVGGSSGGEGALVAAAGTPFSIGTDIGGSIRIPSFMNGVFGHKVSNKLTDTTGLTFRDGSDSETTMVTAGPICRHACDLAMGVKVILGPEASAKLKLDMPVDVATLQYFYMEQLGDLASSPVRGDIAYGLKKVVTHLKTISTVKKLDIPEMAYITTIYKYWLRQEKGRFELDVTNREYEAKAMDELWKYLTCRSKFNFSVIMLLINLQILPCADATWARETTEKLRNCLLEKLSVNGVLLFPSWPTAPQYHYIDYLRPFNFYYTGIFNVLKLPVTQVPLGLNEEGVPIGIQVVAAPMQDHLSIAVARHLEKQFGGYVAPWSKSN